MNLDYTTARAKQMSDAELAIEILRLNREKKLPHTIPGMKLLLVTVSIYERELDLRRQTVQTPEVQPRQARWLPKVQG
jgi:hypothetical protein